MTISFQCPNGHRLTCSDDHGGTTGKCPKCNVAVKIPKANEQAPVPPRNGEAVPNPAPATRTETITFLCPNGHKLNGPAAMQGQAGQCPHCRAKFRIPVFDDAHTSDTRVEEDDQVEDASELEEFEEVADEYELEGSDAVEDDEEDAYPEPPPPSSIGGFLPPMLDDIDVHPLARLFTTLWNEKHHGGLVEIHLGDGVMIIPDWWAEKLSHDKHAVFALQTADGSYVMETIAWDAIKRIIVRRISELPGGVFE